MQVLERQPTHRRDARWRCAAPRDADVLHVRWAEVVDFDFRGEAPLDSRGTARVLNLHDVAFKDRSVHVEEALLGLHVGFDLEYLLVVSALVADDLDQLRAERGAVAAHETAPGAGGSA